MNNAIFIPADEISGEYKKYPRSEHPLGGNTIFMARFTDCDRVVIHAVDGDWLCPLEHDTAAFLRDVFPFTKPQRVLRHAKTLGTGDRLGLASSGHIAAVEGTDYWPVLAQQSMRELMLTNRSFEDVLDCATFAAFREGFETPWGADADHLKTPEAVEYALRCGYTMLTLDSSEKIQTGVEALSDAELAERYTPRADWEATYLDKTFALPGGKSVQFTRRSLSEAAVIYGDALDFITEIYERYLRDAELDFEISIDETATPTTPAQHFFVANELTKRGVRFDTLAPRFSGEFQKGVDYRGDLTRFAEELRIHAAIAQQFDYKLSVHSGSDKFSVFPLVGELTAGRFHLKTAGTSWLEAMRLIAEKEPALYRECHALALAHFEEAKAYYVVSTDLTKIPALDTLSDAELPSLFENDDARQLIHITYGFLLGEKKDALFAAWHTHAEGYRALLKAHIGRHIAALEGK